MDKHRRKLLKGENKLSNIIKWQIPNTKEVSFDLTLIYRASSKEDEYLLIKTQPLIDNTFFDTNGSNTDWYRLRFKNSTTGATSQFSTPIQGGSFYGYCTIDDIRNFSAKMTPTAIKDEQLFELIKFATAQINQDILIEYRDEELTSIGDGKENKINGVNKTFFVQNPYLADYNDDGVLDEKDIYVYGSNNKGEITEYCVNKIESVRHGKFVLEEAPNTGTRMFATYRSARVLLYPRVDMNVRKAAINYVLGLSHMKLDPNQMRSFRVNKVSVTGDSSPSKQYMKEYNNLISKINSRIVRMKKASYLV